MVNVEDEKIMKLIKKKLWTDELNNICDYIGNHFYHSSKFHNSYNEIYYKIYSSLYDIFFEQIVVSIYDRLKQR